jgi:hypothetical protein
MNDERVKRENGSIILKDEEFSLSFFFLSADAAAAVKVIEKEKWIIGRSDAPLPEGLRKQ